MSLLASRIKISNERFLWILALRVRNYSKVVYPDFDHERQAVLPGRVNDKFINREMMEGIFGKQSGL
jgi:hypothetical protein